MNKSHRKLSRAAFAVLIVAAWAGVSGCQSPRAAAPSTPPSTNSPPAAQTNATAQTPAAPLVLSAGNTIRITFPGAHSLDSVQMIRRDGKITLEQGGGEMTAEGLTPHELEIKLLEKYGEQINIKEVSVTVLSSEWFVYVTGAVSRPGKVVAERPLTPLEAVLEAGVDPARANLKKVIVIRENADGKTEKSVINIKDVLDGKPAKLFTLKQADKIIVKEKFNLIN